MNLRKMRAAALREAAEAVETNWKRAAQKYNDYVNSIPRPSRLTHEQRCQIAYLSGRAHAAYEAVLEFEKRAPMMLVTSGK